MQTEIDASFKRFRERMIEAKQKRPRTIFLTKLPENAPAPAPEKVIKCSAQTLEGRKCPYKATNGCFCRKHFLMK